jgi:hypothetical protein
MTTSSAWWYNPKNDKCFLVIGTHNDWLKFEPNAIALGVSQLMRQFIATTQDIDQIRLAAVMEGMVRVRDYHESVSIQYISRNGSHQLLSLVYHCFSTKLRNASWLEIHNMLTDQCLKLALSDLGREIEDPNATIFQRLDRVLNPDSPLGSNIIHIQDWIRLNSPTGVNEASVLEP